MHRYIAFAWNHHIDENQALAKVLANRLRSTLPGWKCALTTVGLQVYQTGQKSRFCRAYLLEPNIGIVLGQVFARNTTFDRDYHEVAFNDDEAQRIKATKGRHLIEQYWGRYVALLREDDGAYIRVLRDPTGAMPCQLTRYRGIDVVCSHIGDCATLGLVNPTINWDHIVAFLWFHRLITKDTGLQCVSQIRAGECIKIGADGNESTFHWSPARAHDARVVEDPLQAMRELRNAIEYCVGAWASCYTSILHQLSGGLDSAIVLACLSGASSHAKIVGQNLYTKSAEGDERAYARKSAQRAGIELCETPLYSSEGILDQIDDSTKVATPTLTDLMLEDRFREKLVRLHETEALFSGQGGDHFFQRANTPLIAAEYASRHGLRPSLLKVIADTSRFTRESIWSVISAVVLSGFLRRHDDPYIPLLKPPPFVSEDTRDAMNLCRIRHPWVDGARHLPGSKVLQVINIIDSQNFYRLSSSYVDIVHPLISQPIVELCLQIPCYMLTYGGIDRALIRDSFRDLVPADIIRRTSKGGTTSYIHRQLANDLPALREFLLDGVLVAQGVLDREKTESTLTESSFLRNSHLLFPMLTALRAEVWSRTWAGKARRAAA